MRKHRKWWMGLGIGIVLGASMLQMILFAQEQERALQEAAEGPQLYSQAELDEAVALAAKEALRQAASEEPASGESVSDPGLSSGSPSTPSSDSSLSPPSSPAVAEQSDKIVSFYINPGMSLTAVARSLEQLGLIDDADDFMDEARSISKNIRTGTAIFTGQPTYEEIIHELIRKKDN